MKTAFLCLAPIPMHQVPLLMEAVKKRDGETKPAFFGHAVPKIVGGNTEPLPTYSCFVEIPVYVNTDIKAMIEEILEEVNEASNGRI